MTAMASTAPVHMVPGERYCVNCDCHLLPRGPWMGEGHAGIRAWQHDEHGHNVFFPSASAVREHEVLLNGAACVHAFEVDCGRNGWVIRACMSEWSPPTATSGCLIFCPRCVSGFYVELTHGDVQLRRAQG